jgi:hypothetical protein
MAMGVFTARRPVTLTVPNWIKSEAPEDGERVRVWRPDVVLACDACGRTDLVWGEYRHVAPREPRALMGAFCAAHLPANRYGRGREPSLFDRL